MERKYYLGLDMGTSSLGWAVTDQEYHLIRAKGKDLWGVRLFPEAESAAGRRIHRVSRRRIQRERARINYLREVFSDAINEVDPGFYQRLDDSKYFPEDKTEKQPFALFAGDGLTDKEYYQRYKTIFHLRSDLIHSTEARDVRLVYLAILNIFKHRGHFLNANLNDDGIVEIELIYSQLLEKTTNFPSHPDMDALKTLLASGKITNSRRNEQIMELLQINKKMPEAEMLKLICGLKGTLSKVFPDDQFDEGHQKFSISFRDGNYEEKDTEMQSILDEDCYETIQILKQIHDWGLLANIMQGEQYLSDARVKAYEKHAQDLKILKSVYKEYGKGRYNKMFRIMEDNNYSAYVGSVNSDKENGKERRGAKKDRDGFYKKLKGELHKMQEDAPDDARIIYLLEEIDKESLLPKQLTSSNGVVPYQVHLKELRKILSNAEKYLVFLKDKDDTGLSISEKIVKLFAFQIPYYIGPLYNDGNPRHNAWVCRREAGKVTPWNFEQKVDVKASSEEFIKRMVKHCTYMQSETVLPKSSLLYEKFMVLNELNKLKINGVLLDVDLKQDIYRDLFCKGKRITVKKIREYLVVRGIIPKKADVELSGIDEAFNSELTSYLRFREIFGVDTLTFDQEQMAEKIIFWATIYGDARAFLRERIQENYGDRLSDKQIKRICGIRFRDWGRLSRAFLELEGADCETGEVLTLINRMWLENVNLMECLSNRYTYLDAIREAGNGINKAFEEIKHEDLDELYISAPVRRMVWQTILVVRELVKIMGCPPEKIFVEMARDVDGKNEKGKRKDSRQKKFIDLYKKCKDDGREWSKEIAEMPENRFRSKKLYLYYTQKGRCMYTGEPIDLGTLFNDNIYDIDHIYPRHYVKDDSIEKNLVLVKKQVNSHKSDTFPIEPEIRKERYTWWKELCEKGFITREKFERLTRSTEFSAEELAAFISRQIVETRQGTKTITDIFEKSFPDSSVIYSKAGVVSDFRHKFDMLKCREINNLHHANDAYLNIVVGNTYNVKFTRNPANFIKDYQRNPQQYQYHMDKLFDYPVSRNGEIAWKTKGWESIRTVRSMMSKNTPLVTQMNYEEHGQLWDQTIYSAADAAKANSVGYVPVNTSDSRVRDVEKYGGYKKYTGAYFFLVEHTVKKERIRSLEAMPLYLKDTLDTNEKIEEYCRDNLGYQEPSVRMGKIKMYSLVKINGAFFYLTGRTGNRLLLSNAMELKLPYVWSKYIKRILSFVAVEEDEKRDISREKNLELYKILTQKHKDTVFGKKPNSIGNKLSESETIFKGLPIDQQIYVLRQILQISSSGNQGADLKLLGGAAKTGISLIGKNISSNKQFVLVSLSPTGVYRKETDLTQI